MATTAIRDEVVEQHLVLVRQIVVQMSGRFPRHVDREELVRAGTLGLLEAARRWEPERGVPFARFASTRIKGAILDAIRAADWAPRSLRTMARAIEGAEQHLGSSLGRSPSLDEVAESLGVTREQVIATRSRLKASSVLALDHAVVTVGEEECTLGELLCDRTTEEPAEVLEGRELRSYLHDAVRLLPERHRAVIAGYFLGDRSSEELAEDLGVTTSRISQLRTEALEMLRTGLDAQFDGSLEEPGPDHLPAIASVSRVARRRAGYAAAIAAGTAWRDRLGA